MIWVALLVSRTVHEVERFQWIRAINLLVGEPAWLKQADGRCQRFGSVDSPFVLAHMCCFDPNGIWRLGRCPMRCCAAVLLLNSFIYYYIVYVYKLLLQLRSTARWFRAANLLFNHSVSTLERSLCVYAWLALAHGVN